MDKKFFKTVFKVTVLSEDYSREDYSLEDINYAITEGDCSGEVEILEVVELSSKEAAKELMDQGSDPEFFGLDEEGNFLEEYDE